MAYRRIRFRNCRIQNSDARLVFEERKFFHITPLLRAPPPHFYTFEAATSTFLSLSSSNTTFLLFSIQHHLHHISLFPPPHRHTHRHTLSAHSYCFPSTTSTTFRLFSLHHHLHHNSIVFRPLSSPPPHFYCFSSTTSNTFLWFLIRYIHHISILSLHHYLCHIPIVCHLPPRPPFCCFPSTTLTTFLLFFLHHLHHHISIVFLFPLHQYQISKASPSCTTTL